MSVTQRSIEVDLPVSIVYNQWMQFEEFPHFMEGVERVTHLDGRRLHWVAEIAGAREEWDAEIVDQEHERRISWRSTEGPATSGVVAFQPLGPDVTRVTLDLDVEAGDGKARVGEEPGGVGKRVEGNLKRFKELLEARRAEALVGREAG